MIQINQLSLPVDHDDTMLQSKIEKMLCINKIFKNHKPKYEYKIIKKSLDARKKPDLFYVYVIGIYMNNSDERLFLKHNRNKDIKASEEVKYNVPKPLGDINQKNPVVIVGDGPAGLFCAYLLSKCNANVIVIERGECVEDRSVSVENFWNGGKLDPESNVQFGEGGAGTFSDGKLNTLVKDKNGRNGYVLETFARFGAKDEITYIAKPHIGTDVLKKIIVNMRKDIENNGGQFFFNTKMVDIEFDNGAINGIKVLKKNDNTYEFIPCTKVVLAIGHSSRDTFEMLYSKDINMQQKDFAVGLRIEHKREIIDKARYGESAVGKLPAADYKVTNKAKNGRSVYSFCMCPGGYVVNASSEANRIAINGMSYSGRDAINSNSALIATVGSKDYESDHPLAGMWFQRKLEETAYAIGKGRIPAETYGEYKNGIIDSSVLTPCMKGAYNKADLSKLFSKDINEAIVESIEKFGYTIEGFNDDNAILSGVESRTSSPVRINRDENYESSIKGLYPCGEGAGYAGGITSAAMDGLRVAEKILEKLKNE